ncbi:hypothetical protein P3X46_023081 [Hevea brasiliensis]|uniref:Uncharacterized protein n=1 Tax=Hevea brasiliensis TaxID=3981 RepID=A0ABQ9LBQ8_HEVBR|nr:uncharacterized protein LOC110651256 [Hevea brasiliensis]KAJ9163411.1 hypothetical protein P3X46_023081 [Hevea brasiliensis]
MVVKISSLLIICCFVLVVVLHTIPQGLASIRILEDIPQNGTTNNNSTGYNQSKGPSKTGLHGSESPHAGSATGGSSPSGTVVMPPPTAVTRVEYGSGGNGNSQDAGDGGGGGGNQPSTQYNYSPPEHDYSPPDYN